jgi:hypothetical protein
MSSHQFIVTVDVDDWDATDGRTAGEFAKAALYSASLRDARSLDGYGDLSAEADISDVELLGLTP